MKKSSFISIGFFVTLATILLSVAFIQFNENHKVLPLKVPCVSYTPFKGSEAPWQLENKLVITTERFKEDLSVLSNTTSCVRTYSVKGYEKLFPVAQEMGFKIWMGLWINADQKSNEAELIAAQKIINQYPDVIEKVIVGNEVMLRQELKAPQLSAIIQKVRLFANGKTVTYADVWEFWQKNILLVDAVDEVMIHILPYWENEPLPSNKAGEHIFKIYEGVKHQLSQSLL